jgi:hypothetical protein
LVGYNVKTKPQMELELMAAHQLAQRDVSISKARLRESHSQARQLTMLGIRESHSQARQLTMLSIQLFHKLVG